MNINRNGGLRHMDVMDHGEEESMLKSEDAVEHQNEVPREPPVETTVEAPAGPQSPPSYGRPASSSPSSQPQKRKIQFNMASKIQIIPDSRQGQLNTTFLETVPGVLKIAEIVLSFISFILAICADRNSTNAAWTEHISFETSIVVSALLLGYVCFPHLTIKDEQTREGLIVVELLFYAINTLLYFIAIWLMVHLSASHNPGGRGAAIIDAILCVALTILFALETIIKLRAWRGENAPSSRIIATGGHSIEEHGRRYDTNSELRRDQGSEYA